MSRKTTAARRPSIRNPQSAERTRLEANGTGRNDWKYWGPYLSERQWGTVREDYSADGAAWEYFPHEHARSRAYRWGENGIGGFSDNYQRLCMAVALWNERDPILKERLFGLTNPEGNHGEDVKELYYYLDATPTHSYLRMLYKYPQTAFPYERLVEENRRRGRDEPEFEIADTGVFDENRYFDVYIEYAQVTPGDILLNITAHNRGADSAILHVLPTLWFRNTWRWFDGRAVPTLTRLTPSHVAASHPTLGGYHAYFDEPIELLFCDNETNAARLWQSESISPFPKDGIHDRVVQGDSSAVNPQGSGTKCAAWHHSIIPPGGECRIRVRISRSVQAAPFADFDRHLVDRRREADEYFATIQDSIADADARLVHRQALAGLIWSKQFYCFDVPQWLDGDVGQPPPPDSRRGARNADWRHLNTADILSIPDKWEYPWFAAWDLAFQCVPYARIDPTFAKEQLVLLTREWYMHPSGQIPAYEWSFQDVNPPVHAWAAWRVFEIDRVANGGRGDRVFLERVFHKLMLNFTWWVNRKDRAGRHVFQGGFLGLDNVGVFDRNAVIPGGGFLDQSDGTSWMAMYALNLMRIALELALENPVYEDVATKFFEHFLYIAAAMNGIGESHLSLWDEQDQFFYDVLHFPEGEDVRVRVRSIVGLIPLCAVEILEPETLDRLPGFKRRLEWFMKYRPQLAALVSRWNEPGRGDRRLLSLLRGHRMKRLLHRALDENEFLSDFGIRSLSRSHVDPPYGLDVRGHRFEVSYAPAESRTVDFGGNSNWRGPIWFSVNYLLIDSLRRFHRYYGDDFAVESPTGSGRTATLREIASDISARLAQIFLRNSVGHRPVFGDRPQYQLDPHFRDHILFHEYFHGDSGCGLGASHQTGWTALIADLLSSD